MRLFERNATAEADIYKRLSFDPEQNTLSKKLYGQDRTLKMPGKISKMLPTPI